MPYVSQEKRDSFLQGVGIMENPGDLNFVLTKVCLEYLENKTESYQAYNDIVGALECCKLEMYRRAVSPYEDVKIAANGDVYSK
jgi:hypothetical protein